MKNKIIIENNKFYIDCNFIFVCKVNVMNESNKFSMDNRKVEKLGQTPLQFTRASSKLIETACEHPKIFNIFKYL